MKVIHLVKRVNSLPFPSLSLLQHINRQQRIDSHVHVRHLVNIIYSFLYYTLILFCRTPTPVVDLVYASSGKYVTVPGRRNSARTSSLAATKTSALYTHEVTAKATTPRNSMRKYRHPHRQKLNLVSVLSPMPFSPRRAQEAHRKKEKENKNRCHLVIQHSFRSLYICVTRLATHKNMTDSYPIDTRKILFRGITG